MSIGAIVAIVIAVIIVVAAGTLAAAEMRRRALHQRFGPEYERLVTEKGARRAAAELTARQRLFAKLNIRPLTDEERANYIRRWIVVQEQFVDDPAYSVNAASLLVMAVLKDCGYPTGDEDQTMRALSVEHARALEGYRMAQRVNGDLGGASTEDLRQALLGYRRLFRELTGSVNGLATGTGPAWASTPASTRVPVPGREAAAPVPGRAASAPVPVPAGVSASAPVPVPASAGAPVPASAGVPAPAPVPVPFPASVRARMARLSPASVSADNTAADGTSTSDTAAEEASADDTSADEADREADDADREIAGTGHATVDEATKE